MLALAVQPSLPAPVSEPGLPELPDLSDWLGHDLDHLVTLSDAVGTPAETPATRAAIVRAAHDLKGLASTYGFPVLARLCKALEGLARREDTSPFLPALIRLHALASAACVREGYTGVTAKPILSAVLVGLETAQLALD